MGKAPSQTLTIRKATYRDIPALVGLAETLLPGEASSKQRVRVLSRSMKDPDYDVLTAQVGGASAGFIDLWIFPDFAEGSDIAIIQNLVVAPAFRGRGIAHALVMRGVELAKKRGAKEVHVSTEMRNKRAISLYREHGFSKLYAFLEKSPL